jgi:hypothetical protein
MNQPTVTSEFLEGILNPRKCVGGSCGTRVPNQLIHMMARELLERRAADLSQLDRMEQKLDQLLQKFPVTELRSAEMTNCRVCGRPTMHMGDLCFTCTKGVNAMPPLETTDEH